jgi:hypothetical protein
MAFMTMEDKEILDRIYAVSERVVALETADETTEDISDDSNANKNLKIAVIGLGATLILTFIYILAILKLI